MADDVFPRRAAPPNPRGTFTPAPQPGPDGQVPLSAFARRHQQSASEAALEVRIATEDPSVTREEIEQFYALGERLAAQRRAGGRYCQD